MFGDRTEYSNIICHGNMVCDPANGLPSRGRVITVEPPFSFKPNPNCEYTIFKGNYTAGWYFAYHSTLIGGGGSAADVLHVEVKDTPGEAGTIFSEVFPSPSPQDLLVYSELDINNNNELLAFNQPQTESTIIIAPVPTPPSTSSPFLPYSHTCVWQQQRRNEFSAGRRLLTCLAMLQVSTPIPVSAPAEIAEDNVGVIELDFVLDEDQHKRGFNVTVNGPQAARFSPCLNRIPVAPS